MKSSPVASPSRRQALLHRAVELLRDHPTFDIPTAGESVEVLSSEDRAEAWAQETLLLLRRRMKLVALVALVLVPPLWAFYVFVSPEARDAISLIEVIIVLICAALVVGARRLTSVWSARAFTICAYIAFGLAASAIIMESRDQRVLVFSGHPQFVVSLLFIPLTVVEAGACASLITLSFAMAIAFVLHDSQPDVILPRTLSLAMTSVLVTAMVYLQGLVRRRAFDAAFDMAVSASQGAMLSNSDFLTGAANRRHFEALASVELARSTRTKRPLSLVMFDLDGFKNVNDTCGHAAGDEVLCEVFRAAQNTVRGSDILARWGGDEFVLALPETDCDAAKHTAQRISEAVAQRLAGMWGQGSMQAKVTLSIGITSIADGESWELHEMIDRADEALYRAKRQGKNCIHIA